MDEITATVAIMGRNYSLRVAADDKAILENAAHRLDETAETFAKQFPNKDHQDHVAMAALIHEIQLVRLLQGPSASNANIEQRLAHIEALLNQSDNNR